MSKSDKHHPECMMPACGLEGKYSPDCAAWQRHSYSLADPEVKVINKPITSKEPELMPCPFCGGAAEIKVDGIYRQPTIYVQCASCFARSMSSRQEARAIDYWNQRAAGPRKPNEPFTPDEKTIMDLLCEATEKFMSLPRTHPMETLEWCLAVHHLQDLLGSRVLRRDYPETFPTIHPDEIKNDL